MVKPEKESYSEIEDEIKDDIYLIELEIERLTKEKPSDYSNKITELKQTKSQLIKNLDSIVSKTNPELFQMSEKEYLSVTNRLINDTIEAYFVYHIRTHPRIVDYVSIAETKGLSEINCEDNIRKWVGIVCAMKSQHNEKELEEEWLMHKEWVCIDDPQNPFSYIMVLTQREYTDPNVLRNILDNFCEWSLEKLIACYNSFKNASQNHEKVSRDRKHSVSWPFH